VTPDTYTHKKNNRCKTNTSSTQRSAKNLKFITIYALQNVDIFNQNLLFLDNCKKV